MHKVSQSVATLSGKPRTRPDPSPSSLNPLAHTALFSFNTHGCLSPPPLKLSCQLDIPGACQPPRQQSGDGPNARAPPPAPSFLTLEPHREAARTPAQAAPRALARHRAPTGHPHPAGEVQRGSCACTGRLPGQDGYGWDEPALDFGEGAGCYLEGSQHRRGLREGMGVGGDSR